MRGGAMPIDYKKYPKNWKEISRAVVGRALSRCELCGAPNHTEVLRPELYNEFYALKWYMQEYDKDCYVDHKFHAPVIDPYSVNMKKSKVILTVHHIDFDKTNNTRENLIALCQKCHLRLDLGHHMKNAKKTRAKKKTASGQMEFKNE
jgi:5-methylcytosine-specific restriction endonuclease McrA